MNGFSLRTAILEKGGGLVGEGKSSVWNESIPKRCGGGSGLNIQH
jgi:hypothetical protein